MVWVEETLFLLQEDQGVRRMFGLDMPFETLIDVGNSTRFAAFSPHDAGKFFVDFSKRFGMLCTFFL